MFESIIATSLYGSNTHYVKGILKKVNDETALFQLDTKLLSNEELKILEDIYNRTTEKEYEDTDSFIITTTKISKVGENYEVIIKPIHIKEESIDCQINPRESDTCHFQIPTEEGNYTKFDITNTRFSMFLREIITTYLKDQTNSGTNPILN